MWPTNWKIWPNWRFERNDDPNSQMNCNNMWWDQAHVVIQTKPEFHVTGWKSGDDNPEGYRTIRFLLPVNSSPQSINSEQSDKLRFDFWSNGIFFWATIVVFFGNFKNLTQIVLCAGIWGLPFGRIRGLANGRVDQSDDVSKMAVPAIRNIVEANRHFSILSF